jgi:hypothetical protein
MYDRLRDLVISGAKKSKFAGLAGSHISTPEMAEEFLQTIGKIDCGSEWKSIVKHMGSTTKVARNVWIIDTEFVLTKNEGVRVLEVALANVQGDFVFDNKVADENTVGELYDKYKNLVGKNKCFFEGTVYKLYGVGSKDEDGHATLTEGSLTMEEVADALQKIIKPDDIILEWSKGWEDHKAMFESLDSIGRASVLPPKRNWVRLIPVWRKIVPGFWSFRLAEAFRMFCPEEEFVGAHRAALDVRMTVSLFQKMLQYLETD